MKYFLIPMVILFSCGNNKRMEKESVTAMNDTLVSVQNSEPDSIAYRLIRDNLYVGKEGEIAFRVTDKSNPEAYELRYVTTVYVNGVTGAEKRLMKDYVDTTSFHVIKEVYYADKSRAYVHNDMSDGGNLATIANVDPKGISVLSCCYAKTKKIVLYQGNIIENADPLTFKIVKSDFEKGQAGLFGKDKHNTYYMGTPITAEEIKQYGVK